MKRMKKLLAVVLALAMVLSLGVSALASNSGEQTDYSAAGAITGDAIVNQQGIIISGLPVGAYLVKEEDCSLANPDADFVMTLSQAIAKARTVRMKRCPTSTENRPIPIRRGVMNDRTSKNTRSATVNPNGLKSASAILLR